MDIEGALTIKEDSGQSYLESLRQQRDPVNTGMGNGRRRSMGGRVADGKEYIKYGIPSTLRWEGGVTGERL